MLDICPICFDKKELICLETCTHGVCEGCIVKTLRSKDSCPVCRTVWCPNMTKTKQYNQDEIINELNERYVWFDPNYYTHYPEYRLITVILDNLVNDPEYIERIVPTRTH